MLCLVLENAPLMESQQAKFDRESYNFQTCGISFESSGLRSSLSMLAKLFLGGERKTACASVAIHSTTACIVCDELDFTKLTRFRLLTSVMMKLKRRAGRVFRTTMSFLDSTETNLPVASKGSRIVERMALESSPIRTFFTFSSEARQASFPARPFPRPSLPGS